MNPVRNLKSAFFEEDPVSISNGVKKIGLIVGETSSLPKETINRYQMAVIPYVIDWEEGKNLAGKNVFEKMREAEKRGIKAPKTSQPSPFTFQKVFKEELKEYQNIICITISSKLSGGYNSALQGREMLKEDEKERVYIIDSLNATAGEGLFVLKAVELIEEGKDIEEIIRELKEFVPKVHLIGMLGDPKWLEMGGRMSHTLAVLVRQMQKIGMRPLIGLKRGVVKPVALKMQAKDIPTALLKELKKEAGNKKNKIGISHADNLEAALKLKEMIEKELKNAEIAFLSLMDPVVGVHTGPDTLVLSWFET